MTDLVLTGILLLAVFSGWRMGTIRVLAGIGSWVIGYQLARRFSGSLAAALTANLGFLQPGGSDGFFLNILSLFIDTSAVANRLVQIVLFVIIFIIVQWLVHRLADLLTGLVRGTILSPVNRVIGTLFATALAATLIVIIHSIVLPAFAKLGFGGQAIAFLNHSRYIMPFLYELPVLFALRP